MPQAVSFWVSLSLVPDMVVLLSRSHRQVLKDHSVSSFPEEACALLIGAEEPAGHILIEEVLLAPNVAEDKQRYFEVDPRVRIAAEKQLRGTAHKIVGVFHSHPEGEAKPSNTDENSVIERDFVWLIAALDAVGRFELNAFQPRMDQNGFSAVKLQEQ
jgi:proteasome lid subunit RPN8/RPN11